MKNSIEIKIVLTRSDILPPSYATSGSAGLDLRYYGEDRTLLHEGMITFECGFRIAIPEGYAALIIPRSSLGKRGITIPNSPGLIDSDYRGPVSVILKNNGGNPFHLRDGDRVAQMVIVPVPKVVWHLVEELDDTERGEGGFGSTGVG